MSVIKVIADAKQYESEMKEATDAGKAVIVDFHATWCGPCKHIAPKFEELSKQYAEKVVSMKVDVDEVDDVAHSCGISAMPTFQLYHNGSKVEEIKGANVEKLQALFEKASNL